MFTKGTSILLFIRNNILSLICCMLIVIVTACMSSSFYIYPKIDCRVNAEIIELKLIPGQFMLVLQVDDRPANSQRQVNGDFVAEKIVATILSTIEDLSSLSPTNALSSVQIHGWTRLNNEMCERMSLQMRDREGRVEDFADAGLHKMLREVLSQSFYLNLVQERLMNFNIQSLIVVREDVSLSRETVGMLWRDVSNLRYSGLNINSCTIWLELKYSSEIVGVIQE